MSVSGNPDIVTNGLVLHLDAADIKSYPRTGTVWYDRSGNGNNGTLVNGVGYSNGGMIFDGVDNYVQISNLYLSTSPASILVWFKAGTQTSNAGSVLRPIIQQGAYNNSFPSEAQGIEINMYRSGFDDVGKVRFSWGGAGVGTYSYLTNIRYDDNKWHFAAIVNNGSTFNAYIDGVFLASMITHTSVSTSTPVNFGGDSSFGDRKFVGYIASAQIYNRALSQQEILQNYNATKSRFQL